MGEELPGSGGKDTALNNWHNRGESSLLFLQKHRVELVEELEDCIDSILDQARQKHLLTKDDFEEVTHGAGPRKQVRRLLDIIDCLGEENASVFCDLFIQIKNSKNCMASENEYLKSIQKHRDVLLRRSDCMKTYNCRLGEKLVFSDYFVNLLLVNGHYSLEIKKNELLTFGQQRIDLQNKRENKLKLSQLFEKPNGRSLPKKILVSGVAGIGKTVFVQKLIFDFSNRVSPHNFDFVLNFTFRDLNLINKPVTLREIILKKHGHLKRILDDIFKNSDKLLVILDGFDEFKSFNQLELDEYVFDPDEQAELPQLIGSLIKGELLSNASIVLTSRPTVINHIPVDFIDRFVIITGFSVTEIEDYFQKFFGDKEVGSEQFVMVRENHFLFTLCYIPAFCWIVCSVIKGCSNLHIERPKTMTDIYCHYLIVLLKYHAHQVNFTKNELALKGVFGLGQIAYSSLLKHETLFYETDFEMFNTLPSDIVNSFLDKTCVPELGYVENVLSFTHFTVQEFFAAFYYVHVEEPLDDIMDLDVQKQLEIDSGYLDLFLRLGENNLDLKAIRIICNILISPDCKINLLGLGWTQLEDEEFLELFKCLPHNRSLTGLWLEGNNISYKAIEQISDISSVNPNLQHIVLLGNNLQADDITALKKKSLKSVIAAHIDENFGQVFWEGWWDWIFQRCKMCNDEKIVSFLTKVYRGLSLCNGKETEWMRQWYTQLDSFLQERIHRCAIKNISKRMEALRLMFQEQLRKM
ncbi:NACHT, LRR and PYD domains-containing protein 3-like isoform X3 [Lithobates pipiens]